VKAALLYGPGDLRVEEVPRPEPGPGDVLAQVEEHNVEFIRFWFTDIFGQLKSFAVGREEAQRWCGAYERPRSRSAADEPHRGTGASATGRWAHRRGLAAAHNLRARCS